MRSQFRRAKKEALLEPEMNLTPLIDVVFVILIGFIMIAPLLEIDKVELADASPSASHQSIAAQETSPIAIHVRQDNAVYFNSKKVSLTELLPLLQDAKKRYPKTTPQLFHDRKAHFGTYQGVKNTMEEAGFSQVDIILKPSGFMQSAQFLNPETPSFRWIIPTVIAMHLAAAFWLTNYSIEPPAPSTPKKMAVMTVALTPRPTPKQVIERKDEKIAAIEEAAPPPKVAEVQKEVIPQPAEKPAPKTPPKVEPEKSAPSPQPKQETPKDPPPAPKTPHKPVEKIPPKKPNPKTPPKAQPAAKAPPKPKLDKPKQPTKKPAPDSKPVTPKAKELPAKPAATETPKSTPTEPQKPDPKQLAMNAKRNELISLAKEKIGKIDLNSGRISNASQSNIVSVATPSRIEALSIDKLSIDTDSPLNVKEAAYKDELRYRLKLLLKLPEYGDVKLKLTINRAGKVTDLKIMSAASTVNRDYIEKNLPKQSLPPFGSNFPGSENYTFTITISNE